MGLTFGRILQLSFFTGILLPYAAVAQTYSRTEVTVYHDDTTLWIMGQVRSTTCVAAMPVDAYCDGEADSVVSLTDYGWKALPWKVYEFGKLKQTLLYDSVSSVGSAQLGTLKTLMDGNGGVTTFASWKRGVPQSIQYPATPESPAGAIQSAVVDNNGWITSVTDELGARTCYGYDEAGRIKLIMHPTETPGSGACDESDWLKTTIEFRPMTAGEWRPPGVEAGQWRQHTATGNYQKVVYFDAMWRPVLSNEYDAANTSGTLRAVSTTYDAAGRVAFQSYPSVDIVPAATGVWTFYDGLGRVKEVRQDSEQGQLITRTEYLGLQRRVIGPNNEQTLTTYQAFDQPSYELPVQVDEPLGRTTRIPRDVFGKPTEIERIQ